MIRTHLAGNKHRTVDDQLAFRSLLPGTQLTLEPEPDNNYDSNAVKVLDEDGHHLGYIPASRCMEVLDLLNDNPGEVTAIWMPDSGKDKGHLEIATSEEVEYQGDGEQE